MKRLLIVSLLCLALVGAAVAASVELKGLLNTEVEYRPEEPLGGFTTLRLDMESQMGSKLKGVFGIRLQDEKWRSVSDWYGYELNDLSYYPYAFVEAEGSLWEGAEPVKMTMGSLDVKYSPYVAWYGYDTRNFYYDDDFGFWDWYYFNDNGITFDNIKLGTISARGFYMFDNLVWADNYYILGANFKGAFDDIDLDATFVSFGEPIAYDIVASLSPVKDINLSGQFISDGVAEEGWYKFAVSYTGIPNWQLGAAYRDFSTPLDLILRDTTPPVVDGSFVIPNPYFLNVGLEGMILTAATNYAGYDFSGEYDYALRRTYVEAAKDNWSAKLKLFYPWEDDGFGDEVESLVVFRGSTTADVAMLKNVKFEGVVEFGKEAVYGGSATYKAPIGLDVVAEYYSDNLKDDDGLGWIQEKGLVIRAGYTVNF